MTPYLPLIPRISIAVILSLSMICNAQTAYPTKPIKLIIPLASGSAVDNAARILTLKTGENIGQAFVLENITGSAGFIGAERVARATPDGYTIGGYNDSILTILTHMMAKMPLNTLTDFEPISHGRVCRAFDCKRG